MRWFFIILFRYSPYGNSLGQPVDRASVLRGVYGMLPWLRGIGRMSTLAQIGDAAQCALSP